MIIFRIALIILIDYIFVVVVFRTMNIMELVLAYTVYSNFLKVVSCTVPGTIFTASYYNN